MKGWVKYFVDGTSERGIDSAVRQKRASWSRGRLNGLVGVESHHDRYTVKISGPGVYHQSDDCEVRLYQSHSRVVVRRLQRKIGDGDNFVVLTAGTRLLDAQVFEQLPHLESPPVGSKREIISLDDDHTGKWLTLEMDLTQGEMRLRFVEDRI